MSWAVRFRIRQQVRQSLWAVPLLGAIAGVVVSRIDVALEGRWQLPAGWSYSSGTASSVLAAIAGAMVGLLGLVVTITVLVVQMATGTLSARFMRLWYRDRVQKITLAAFTATFTFSYALLRRIEPDSVPDIGVSAAGVAVTLDLILLLVYVDRFLHMLRPVAVAAAMAQAGLRIIRLMGDRSQVPYGESGNGSAGTLGRRKPDVRVRAGQSGAIQAVHTEGLVRWATRHSAVCVLPHAVGDFVIEGGVVVDVYGVAGTKEARRLRGMVALGHERTIDQDPAFALRIMVDIAIRALSPAVNDPTTATQLINHIGAFLTRIGSSETATRRIWLDPAARLRLVIPSRTWEDYLQLGVSEIRLYGVTSAQTSRRLRAMLSDLAEQVPADRRPAVAHQLTVLDRVVASSVSDPDDRRLALGQDEQGIGGAGRHTAVDRSG
ncbi:DUF2254 domain-containing protein [Microlunatus elymi]|uniref:DUF2254 domain-containing protein n=1 Tax=Microlunatus elymi TaxID=2596828 RepID=UPI001AEFBB04|nr:DUF2254 family protein [Microlunatus elymi]